MGHGPQVTTKQNWHGWCLEIAENCDFHVHFSWHFMALLRFTTTQRPNAAIFRDFWSSTLPLPTPSASETISDSQQILQGWWATCCWEFPALAKVIQDLLNRFLRGKWFCPWGIVTMVYSPKFPMSREQSSMFLMRIFPYSKADHIPGLKKIKCWWLHWPGWGFNLRNSFFSLNMRRKFAHDPLWKATRVQPIQLATRWVNVWVM